VPELTPAVLQHRVERFLELGFNEAQAVRLAEARDSAGFLVDTHAVARTLAAPCDLLTAFAIYA
jgi:hypothetical protein